MVGVISQTKCSLWRAAEAEWQEVREQGQEQGQEPGPWAGVGQQRRPLPTSPQPGSFPASPLPPPTPHKGRSPWPLVAGSPRQVSWGVRGLQGHC